MYNDKVIILLYFWVIVLNNLMREQTRVIILYV